MCVLHWSSLPFPLSLSTSFSPFFLLLFCIWFLHLYVFFPPSSTFSLCNTLFPSHSSSSAVGSDLKDIQNNKNRYLIASENQRPGHFSTAPIGSLTASPSSGSLCSQVGLQSVTSIQERIMSTPGGEEAIERLKVQLFCADSLQQSQSCYPCCFYRQLFTGDDKKLHLSIYSFAIQTFIPSVKLISDPCCAVWPRVIIAVISIIIQ